MVSLYTLPKEIYAEIARYLGSDFPSDGFRRAAGNVKIKDVINNGTYLNGLLHSFDDHPAFIDSHGNIYWYSHGMSHRDNCQPAIIWVNGKCEWYSNGYRIHHASGLLHSTNDILEVIYNDTSRYWAMVGQNYRHGV